MSTSQPPKQIDLADTIDVTNISDTELKNLKSDVIKRLLGGQGLARSVVSNLDVSHNRHSSVHSKG